MFLIHDEIVPHRLFPRGGAIHIGEKPVLVFYGAFAAWFFWTCRRAIARTDRRLLALAVALLCLSVLTERGFTKRFIPSNDLRAFLEDGFKLLGIIGWSWYFACTAHDIVLGRLLRPGAPEPDSPQTVID